MKKFIITLMIVVAGTSIFGADLAYAADQLGTLLPQTSKDANYCKELLDKEDTKTEDPAESYRNLGAAQQDLLGCAIKTGRIKFWMIPYFMVYIIEFIIGLSGLIAILFIVIGGYKYILAGATEKKDEAKNTIKNAVIGLVMVLVAWIVVNVIQYLVTI